MNNASGAFSQYQISQLIKHGLVFAPKTSLSLWVQFYSVFYCFKFSLLVSVSLFLTDNQLRPSSFTHYHIICFSVWVHFGVVAILCVFFFLLLFVQLPATVVCISYSQIGVLLHFFSFVFEWFWLFCLINKVASWPFSIRLLEYLFLSLTIVAFSCIPKVWNKKSF